MGGILGGVGGGSRGWVGVGDFVSRIFSNRGGSMVSAQIYADFRWGDTCITLDLSMRRKSGGIR